MAGRLVSVPMTLSKLERPEVRKQFFLGRIFITLVRSATSLHLYKCVAQFASVTVLWLLNPFSSVTLTLLIIMRSCWFGRRWRWTLETVQTDCVYFSTTIVLCETILDIV